MTNSSPTFPITWNLHSLCSSKNPHDVLPFKIQKLKEELIALKKLWKSEEKDALAKGIEKFQEVNALFYETGSLILCLMAQDVNDEKAIEFNSQQALLHADYESLSSYLDTKLLQLSESDFQLLIQTPELKAIAFNLAEKRKLGKDKLSLECEHLIHHLSINGYQGWDELYRTFLGKIRIPWEKGELSIGQAGNKLVERERSIRKKAFETLEKMWEAQAPFFAQILNHIAGFRLQLYQLRNWENILKEPLDDNRMDISILNIMWNVITEKKAILKKYLRVKAKLLGLKKLSWYDVEAPLPLSSEQKFSFQEAADLIIHAFTQFSPRMGKFAERSFKEGWIEAEDRKGKLPGGFCTGFPESKESRIFMTFSGTTGSLSTLAHELGHAYHNEIIQKLPILAQDYKMNVAETASILAEQILFSTMLQESKSKDETLFLLDIKLSRAVLFFMDIHARFLFECKFYEKRKEGFISAEQLSKKMVEAQKEAFLDELDIWHPYFWMSKMHFYFTSRPFYNFPYTFGYLFSLGLFGKFLQEGPSFVNHYDALLEDTGRMDVLSLAKKHLDVDLAKPDFWMQAFDVVENEVNAFEALSQK